MRYQRCGACGAYLEGPQAKKMKDNICWSCGGINYPRESIGEALAKEAAGNPSGTEEAKDGDARNG